METDKKSKNIVTLFSEPKFYSEPYLGYGNKPKTKIGCAIPVEVLDGENVKTFYAYGSTVYSRSDWFRLETAVKIAQQRVDKIVEKFAEFGFNSEFTGMWLAYSKARMHMELFTADEFKNLEARALQPFIKDGNSVWR